MRFKNWLEAVRLQEGEPTVVLYRGDPTPINSFSLAKASPMCLFGAGIYLTDNIRLARDYTYKGSDSTGEVLFRFGGGSKATKEEAIERYVEWKLASYLDEHGNDIQWGKTLPSLTHDPIRIARIKQAWKKWDKMKRGLEVRKLTDGDIIIRKKTNSSQITAYQVPVRILDTLLNADEQIPERVAEEFSYVLRRLGDEGRSREIWTQATKEDDDGFLPTYRQVYTTLTASYSFGGEILTGEGQKLLRAALKKLGYNGIKYQGGITVGNIRHNAYVFWDEQGLSRLMTKKHK